MLLFHNDEYWDVGKAMLAEISFILLSDDGMGNQFGAIKGSK
jgi:hypothetical protein